MAFVLDRSVALAWLLQEETNARTDALLMARRRGFPLATLEEKLRQAGKALKVSVLP